MSTEKAWRAVVKSSWCFQARNHRRPQSFEVSYVPRVDRLSLCFERALGDEGIVDRTAYYA